MFHIDSGILYTGIALIFFYLYIAWLRGRKRRMMREVSLEISKAHGEKKRELVEQLSALKASSYQIRSWVLLIAMMLLLCLSLIVRNGDLLSQYKEYWWVASVVGVVGFAFSLK